MKVKEELGIFWHSSEGQTETCGIEFFGLFKTIQTEVVLEPQKYGWSSPNFDCHINRIEGANCLVWSVEVRVIKWPDDITWRNQVEATLKGLTAAGAVVSWAGGYDCSWSPHTLNPVTSKGNVYAAYSTTTGLLCNAGLSEEMRFLDDAQLMLLWKVIGEN